MRVSSLRLYLLAVGVAGLVAVMAAAVALAQHSGSFSTAATLNSPWSPFTLALFTVMDAVALLFVILVPEEHGQSSSHNLGTVGVVASIVVFPPYVAILMIAFVAALVQIGYVPTGRRRAWPFTVFNIGSLTLSTALAALVFAAFNGRRLLLTPHLPQEALALIAAVAAVVSIAYVVSYGLLVVSRWLTARAIRRLESGDQAGRSIRPSSTSIRE